METESGSLSARTVLKVDTSILSIASKYTDYASNVILGLLRGLIERLESQNCISTEVIWSPVGNQSPSAELPVSGKSMESISSRMPAALS